MQESSATFVFSSDQAGQPGPQQHELERSHHILSSITQGVMFLDAEFRVRQMNAEGLRIDGRPAAEVLGRTHWELWPGTEELAVGQAYKRAMRERTPVSLEQSYLHVGRQIWFDIQAYPVDGGIVAFYRDITLRKQAESALAEREEQLRLAIDAADVGEWDVDMATDVMYWPARVKAMFGMSAERPVTLADFYEGVHPDDRERTFASFADTANPALRSQYDAEYRTIGREDGIVRWVAARGRGLFNEAGECTRIIGTAIDITRRKASEEALRASEERLRDADRRKDEFLAMLAHELRNPLAPIRAGADLLQAGRLDEERVRKTSQIIGRQVRHMTALVDDLLDVSRVTRGRVELDATALDINQVVTEALEQVAPLVRARRQRLELELTPEAVPVMGDRKRLVQVLANLLNNAVKYTHEGGTISLRSQVAGDEVVVQVADNGIGMSRELMDCAFDLFAQAERHPDRSSGGLGLGLALVRSLLELHGGAVSCASPGLGEGSCFLIRLPRLAAPFAAAGAGPCDLPGSQGRRAALQIMLVDDNVDAAAMLGMLLESAGHRVSVLHDAHAALERAGHERPDVFLLDIGLPDVDGKLLARRLRAQPAHAGAVMIAVTGYGQEHDRQQSAAAGFDHHLVKPVDFRQMSAILAAIVPAGDAPR